jgi:hypothetical protein
VDAHIVRSPEPQIDQPRFTREQIEALFKPCPICGEIERMTSEGVYRIQHNYSAHGMPPARNRGEQ